MKFEFWSGQGEKVGVTETLAVSEEAGAPKVGAADGAPKLKPLDGAGAEGLL